MSSRIFISGAHGSAWAKPNPQFDHTIMTNELFGQSPRSSLKSCFSALGLDIDHAAIDSWRQKNIAMLEPYNIRFSWTPGWSVPEGWISAAVVENKLDDPSK